jgi:hypothetical protein
MRCDVGDCRDPAAGLFTWGLYPAGDHNRDVPLCAAHVRALWDQLRGAVAASRMHFEARPPEADRR